jgi:hypothetical protein
MVGGEDARHTLEPQHYRIKKHTHSQQIHKPSENTHNQGLFASVGFNPAGIINV